MAKVIRALLGFARLLDSDLASRALALLKGLLTNSAIFSSPPCTLEAFQATLDAFVHAIPAALDGGKKAIAEKNSKRKTLEGMMKQLAAYVEVVAAGDIAIFLSSGLEPVSSVRVAAMPLSAPTIRKIQQGTTGQFLAFANAKKGATHYEWRCAALDGAGTPGPWTVQMAGNARSAVAFNNLMPGTTYMFQARVLSKLGLTDWGPAISQMVDLVGFRGLKPPDYPRTTASLALGHGLRADICGGGRVNPTRDVRTARIQDARRGILAGAFLAFPDRTQHFSLVVAGDEKVNGTRL